MSKIFQLFLFFFLLCIGVYPASAEEKKNVYDKIPDEYIEEALNFHDKCAADFTYNEYYDCKCLATEYLDERVKLGSGAHSTKILMNINKKCKDTTQSAGREYQQCLGMGMMMPRQVSAKSFCTCYANTYAKAFKRAKMSPNSQAIVKLQSLSLTHCRRLAEQGKLEKD